ncbi:hypothetical protein NPIL_171621, partial [Nephila pilipes]
MGFGPAGFPVPYRLPEGKTESRLGFDLLPLYPGLEQA